MTKSFPWQGIVGGAGAGDDSGRYTSGEWWSAWGIQQRASGLVVPTAGASLRTLAAWTNIGVYYGVDNKLEVTDGGGFVADVDTGAALVEGAFFYENTARVLTMPASQTYYIVVRKNYSAVDYTPPGYAAGDGVVPAYTCRITWVAALVQDTTRVTYWDIPLATVVTDGAEITTVTDTREYVDAEEKRVLVQVTRTENHTDGTDPLGYNGNGYITLDNKESWLSAGWHLPSDFIDSLTLALLVIPGASGNYYGKCGLFFAEDGEASTLNQDGIFANTADAVINGNNCVILQSDITGVTKDDFIQLFGSRNAIDANDTVAASVFASGFYITYMGTR